MEKSIFILRTIHEASMYNLSFPWYFLFLFVPCVSFLFLAFPFCSLRFLFVPCVSFLLIEQLFLESGRNTHVLACVVLFYTVRSMCVLQKVQAIEFLSGIHPTLKNMDRSSSF